MTRSICRISCFRHKNHIIVNRAVCGRKARSEWTCRRTWLSAQSVALLASRLSHSSHRYHFRRPSNRNLDFSSSRTLSSHLPVFDIAFNEPSGLAARPCPAHRRSTLPMHRLLHEPRRSMQDLPHPLVYKPSKRS